jgi:glycine/D-amino acid oxidase-like deaminating enzyme
MAAFIFAAVSLRLPFMATVLEAVISISGLNDAEQEDLRSPRTPWGSSQPRHIPILGSNICCETLVVGAGITGALVAERLTREGRIHQGLGVVVIDREDPSLGSTAASTAMLLWEIDRPLSELVKLYGFERAVRCYRASLQAARGLQALILESRLRCQMRPRQSLYLAAREATDDLRGEARLREKAGLPGHFLDHPILLELFEIARAGAILSPFAADTNPVLLTQGLLQIAVSRGARLFSANAVKFDAGGSAVFIALENGSMIEAQHLVLATGYALPNDIHPTVERVASSFAIATRAQPQNIWRGGALIWEAGENYHYARTTEAGRIIFGGEDDHDRTEPAERDRALPEKAERLARRLKALWPRAQPEVDLKWGGTFDATRDGLPLIGRIPGFKNTYAAYGYGGNGITFSHLAAQLISDLTGGRTSPLLDDFAIDRDL